MIKIVGCKVAVFHVLCSVMAEGQEPWLLCSGQDVNDQIMSPTLPAQIAHIPVLEPCQAPDIVVCQAGGLWALGDTRDQCG